MVENMQLLQQLKPAYLGLGLGLGIIRFVGSNIVGCDNGE